MFERKKFENLWDGRIEPFRIVGDVYFVGSFAASTHIIDTGDGIILIDPGYLETLHLVVDSIYKMRFKPEDIKYIVNTHWHYDHTGGTKALTSLCGAKTLIGGNDAERASQYFKADILIKDGDVLELGKTKIRFLETPGHTKGTISPFFETEENGKVYRVGMFGGAGANTLARGSFDYDNCREDYLNSVHRLMSEKVDVFIGNHVWNNNTEVFGEILRKTGENKFIDSSLWTNFLNFCEKRAVSLAEADKE